MLVYKFKCEPCVVGDESVATMLTILENTLFEPPGDLPCPRCGAPMRFFDLDVAEPRSFTWLELAGVWVAAVLLVGSVMAFVGGLAYTIEHLF